MEPIRHHLTARARPLRVAYLVPWAETSHTILDDVTKAASSYWGGRFSLMVPCKDDQPLPEFEAWLESFDADVIYSYVELTNDYQRHIHEWLDPSELRVHKNDTKSFRPALPLEPLSVDSVIPLVATANSALSRASMPIVELAVNVADDLFLKQNFAVLTPSTPSARSGMSRFSSRLLVCAPGEMEALSLAKGESAQRATGVIGLLNMMTDLRFAKSVVNLAAATTGQQKIRHPAWRDSFHVVVGDTVDDRLLFWNGRFLTEHTYSGEDVDLFVPSERMNDPIFIEALARFVERRNSVYHTSTGSEGTSVPTVTLRSISLDEERLGAYAKRLQNSLIDQEVTYEGISSLAALGRIHTSPGRANPMICSSKKRFFTSNLLLVGDWTRNRAATQIRGDVGRGTEGSTSRYMWHRRQNGREAFG